MIKGLGLFEKDVEPAKHAYVTCRFGHVRQVWTYQLDTKGTVMCDTCREPMRVMGKQAVADYKGRLTLCDHCQSGNHDRCWIAYCWACPGCRQRTLERDAASA